MGLAQEVPKSIGSFAALQIIDLSGNNLAGPIPTQIGSLLSLTTINLSGNQISGSIPSQIGQLKSLELIELSQNQLVGGIPTQLAQLSNIKALKPTHRSHSSAGDPKHGQKRSNSQLWNELPGWTIKPTFQLSIQDTRLQSHFVGLWIRGCKMESIVECASECRRRYERI
ncbi:L domain-like protein [Rhizoclosmatium globosum]|uniref:L domain-like protein n=1 Tax=Rhizoclosmatium globosum TaxID=329046 RepID=A0A1Y2CG16_9FUNG|nr:L domain-like protein [Rhizoclosmatium globosum]|eukprot:ORY45876.1 L domain-like protein [Rhizoclosmatium globosum]